MSFPTSSNVEEAVASQMAARPLEDLRGGISVSGRTEEQQGRRGFGIQEESRNWESMRKDCDEGDSAPATSKILDFLKYDAVSSNYCIGQFLHRKLDCYAALLSISGIPAARFQLQKPTHTVTYRDHQTIPKVSSAAQSLTHSRHTPYRPSKHS